jgi:hypothetical protein
MSTHFDQVVQACPELTKAECEAVRDHLYDTTRDGESWYKDLIQSTARSLFPYQAKPKESVVFMKQAYLKIARQHLQAASKALGDTTPNDNVAQIHLDVQCCIHYISEELGDFDGGS